MKEIVAAMKPREVAWGTVSAEEEEVEVVVMSSAKGTSPGRRGHPGLVVE
ncbi:hypothetical protein ACFVU2_09655 [Leifsonia sp. NPDC058194]